MGKFRNIAPEGMSARYAAGELLSPKNWLREFRFSRQRKERGFSDRDTWNGGDYILEVTSGVLRKLGDDKSHIDWDKWFKDNIVNNRGYKSLAEVAEDIDHYLEFEDHSWSKDLGFEIKHGTREDEDGDNELISLNTPNEERLIRKAIVESHEEEQRRYEKAKNAMIFVAINFRSLWD